MAIKELAYSAQQHLQSSTGCSFKRAHVYELLAASFGFKSYAALFADHVFTQRHKSTAISAQHQLTLRQRALVLGYERGIADAIASAFPHFLNEHRLDVVGIVELAAALKGEVSFSDTDSGWDEDDRADSQTEGGLPEGLPLDRDTGKYPPILLECLEAAASKGDQAAHYALALIYASAEDEDEQQAGSEYWYSQAHQGRVLTGAEKEWADAYARQLDRSQKYVLHLREAGRLGNTAALLDLAELFDDPAYLDAATAHGITDEPLRVSELAETLGRNEDARHWLTVAAEAGDTDAMRRLIEDFEHADLRRSWMWLYLASMLGTDLTASRLQAFHEGGQHADELYDDDVGGPLYVAGDEGVSLEPLDGEQDREARKLAEAIFHKIHKIQRTK